MADGRVLERAAMSTFGVHLNPYEATALIAERDALEAENKRLRVVEMAARRLAEVDGMGPLVETAAAWADLRAALKDGA